MNLLPIAHRLMKYNKKWEEPVCHSQNPLTDVYLWPVCSEGSFMKGWLWLTVWGNTGHHSRDAAQLFLLCIQSRTPSQGIVLPSIGWAFPSHLVRPLWKHPPVKLTLKIDHYSRWRPAPGSASPGFQPQLVGWHEWVEQGGTGAVPRWYLCLFLLGGLMLVDGSGILWSYSASCVSWRLL